MRIIVDAMGGDLAPQAPIQGAVMAYQKYGCAITLVGQKEVISAKLKTCGLRSVPPEIEIVDAREVVEICDDPATAFKTKKDSSLTVGLTRLRDGEGDGFVSAGSTGALLAGATLVTKRIRGLRRAAMAPVLPTANGHLLLLDCGANAECTVEYLVQFAYLGNFYAKHILGIETPRVGLLNIGAEPSKGDTLRRETYLALREADQAGDLLFVGNVEANTALDGACDVLVADGYSGNIMLKTIEGTAKLISKKLKREFMRNLKTKLCALGMKKGVGALRAMLDPNRIGGTAFLGISKPVIKAHGSSNAEAFCNAIHQAMLFAESGIIEEIEQNVDKMKVETVKENR